MPGLVPGIHVLLVCALKTWMAGTSPAMTDSRNIRMLKRLVAALGLLVALCFAQSAHAASYPTHPVTLVVAFTPGGPSDVLARIVGQRLEKVLHQPVVIENRPGGSGNIA